MNIELAIIALVIVGAWARFLWLGFKEEEKFRTMKSTNRWTR